MRGGTSVVLSMIQLARVWMWVGLLVLPLTFGLDRQEEGESGQGLFWGKGL